MKQQQAAVGSEFSKVRHLSPKKLCVQKLNIFQGEKNKEPQLVTNLLGILWPAITILSDPIEQQAAAAATRGPSAGK